jgi:Tol biopolymer transport system component
LVLRGAGAVAAVAVIALAIPRSQSPGADVKTIDGPSTTTLPSPKPEPGGTGGGNGTGRGSSAVVPGNQDATGSVPDPLGGAGNAAASVAPGRLAVIDSSSGGGSNLYALNADGSSRSQLTNDTNFNSSVVWSPDASKLAFLSNANTGPQLGTDLVVINADGSGRKMLRTPLQPESATNGTHSAWAPTWSHDSRSLAYAAQHYGASSDTDIEVVDVDGHVSQLTTGPESDMSPVWSPVEDRLAFVRHNGSLGQVNIVTPGAAPQPIGPSQLYIDTVDWSSDGSRLAFTGYDPVASYHAVWLMNSDGSGVQQVTASSSYYFAASWSPDGQHLVVHDGSSGGGTSLGLLGLDGSLHELVSNGFFIAMSAQPWSPDGRTIAYCTGDSSGGSTLWTVGLDGSLPVRIPTSTGCFAAAWSPR